ncbi:MAG: glycoside hydrolase family 1 protein [Elusimicrobia bacterium]|nr:glycoside hydrolase family 1 protein [Elusimicrobiota bacterium]
MAFPKGFLWGCASSAYQVEGGNLRSNWAAWERRKGLAPCGAAANSWDLWREDLACLKALNANAYRFSVEWSRVEPHPGEFDQAALDRYTEMARALRQAGIRPIVTLHHFSEPAWLYERRPKGWLEDGPEEDFTRFVDRVVLALRGEVDDWITFNEPMVWLLSAYGLGRFPPGLHRIISLERNFIKNGLIDRVARAHRAAYLLIRGAIPKARVAIAQNVVDLEPARPRVSDLEATQAWDRFMHRHLLDLLKSSKTLDFIGLNYYTRIFVRGSRLFPLGTMPCYRELEVLLGRPLFRLLGGRRGGRPETDMGWEIVPEGLGRVALSLWRAYGLPVFVTENGLADAAGDRREAFLREHVAALAGAAAQGAELMGYLHWSLIDNYEWGDWGPRFGLFSVDRERGFRRDPAAGSKLFAELAASNGACLS